MTSVANGELRYQLWDLLWFHSRIINSSCLLPLNVSLCWQCVPGAWPRGPGEPFGSYSKWKGLTWTWEPPCSSVLSPPLPLWGWACVWANDQQLEQWLSQPGSGDASVWPLAVHTWGVLLAVRGWQMLALDLTAAYVPSSRVLAAE